MEQRGHAPSISHPITSNPVSVKGNSGAEPELLQKAAVQGKTSSYAAMGLRSYFWFPRPHQQSGLHLQQATGLFLG